MPRGSWSNLGARSVAAGALLAVLGATAPPGSARESSAPPVEAFEETIEVEVVNVEVVVTDRAGQRVGGLAAGDFLVRVDGEETPVRYFSEVGEAAAGPGRSEGAAGGTSTDDPGVSFLVFIDDHVALKSRRDVTLERLRAELPLLRAGDRMAIIAYDGRRLRVLSAWTGSREVLEGALEAAVGRPAEGIKWVAYARMTGFVANWIGNATRRSVLAAASSLRILPAPAGRKVMLLIAGSWDPAELGRAESFSPWCLAGPCVGNFVLTALTDTANRLGYSIYAADVEGRDVQGDWAREKRLQDTLTAVSRETGGRPLLNADRTRVLSVASADSRSYYSLGIEPRVSRPPGRHRVEVEVLRPGLEVRNRSSFVAVAPRRLRELDTYGELISAAALERPDFPLEPEEPERLPGRRMRQPLSVFAPIGALTWIPVEGRYRARFEIQLASLDARGNSSVVETHEVELDEAQAASPGDLDHLQFDLELARRPHTLAVIVRDLQSERLFRAVTEIAPPEREGSLSRP